MNRWVFVIVLLIFITISCTTKNKSVENTLFKMGFRTTNYSTGPLMNSLFIYKVHDTIPPLILTAHHVVAGKGNGDTYYAWNELSDKVQNAWLWSMQDSSYQLPLGENLPIPGARTMKFDLAAFYLSSKENVSSLTPATVPAQVGDSVTLFSRLRDGLDFSNSHHGIVIHATDSMLVYELQSDNLIRMEGSSGSPVVNGKGEVISNSVGGFTIPNVDEIENIAKLFLNVKELNVKVGKAYGIGVPVRLINESIRNALKLRRELKTGLKVE